MVMLQVDKIVMFDRGQVVHALVQFAEVAAAITARYLLVNENGVSRLYFCCILQKLSLMKFLKHF